MPVGASAMRTAVADAVHSAAIHVLRGVRREDTRTGLSPARLSALSVLVFGGPMRLTDLARLEHVTLPTMTKLVAALEGEKLVRREPEPGDARASRLSATRRGKAVLQEGRRRRVERLAQAMNCLTGIQLEQLARAATLLEELSTRMSKQTG